MPPICCYLLDVKKRKIAPKIFILQTKVDKNVHFYVFLDNKAFSWGSYPLIERSRNERFPL